MSYAPRISRPESTRSFKGCQGGPENESSDAEEQVVKQLKFGRPATSILFIIAMVQRERGYVINGIKHFCTMAGAATYYMVWCALPGPSICSSKLTYAKLIWHSAFVSDGIMQI